MCPFASDTVFIYSIKKIRGIIMAAIEFERTFIAGGTFTLEKPLVDVMGKNGALIPVLCAGVAYCGMINDEIGHKVKVIARRYTNDNPMAQATWIDLKDNEAVLGFRTHEYAGASNQWVVFLMSDRSGKLIIVPRKSESPKQLRAG